MGLYQCNNIYYFRYHPKYKVFYLHLIQKLNGMYLMLLEYGLEYSFNMNDKIQLIYNHCHPINNSRLIKRINPSYLQLCINFLQQYMYIQNNQMNKKFYNYNYYYFIQINKSHNRNNMENKYHLDKFYKNLNCLLHTYMLRVKYHKHNIQFIIMHKLQD